MKIEDYKEIVNTIKKYQGLCKDCAKMLIHQYTNFSPMTLHAILSLEMQGKMRKNHWKIIGKKDKDLFASFIKAVENRKNSKLHYNILLQMAIDFDMCPTMMARKILEYYCKLEDENVNKQDINKMMKDTTLIKDKNLAYEIYMCILYDNQYGPITNAMNESIGEEYEIKLEGFLVERKIPFYNENHLRAKGYDKTPDFKLEIPIAVNGFVVNWIESKAQFGSPKNHENYIKEQFLSYWNRFGPGLVIYWFGFVDNIVQSNETRFIVMDHFPQNLTYMDPSSVATNLF